MKILAALATFLLCVTVSAREPVRARHAMVAAQEPHATDVGVAVLKAGGNAVDAAVAVGFALAVTHSTAGNIGGGFRCMIVPQPWSPSCTGPLL